MQAQPHLYALDARRNYPPAPTPHNNPVTLGQLMMVGGVVVLVSGLAWYAWQRAKATSAARQAATQNPQLLPPAQQGYAQQRQPAPGYAQAA